MQMTMRLRLLHHGVADRTTSNRPPTGILMRKIPTLFQRDPDNRAHILADRARVLL
jgi:hypothetical protein